MLQTGRERTQTNLRKRRADTAPPARLGRRSVLASYMINLKLLNRGIVGRPIGSAMIDMDFHQILSKRLESVQDHLQGDPDTIADQMMQGRFERIKCSFGAASSLDIPVIPLPVPSLPPGFCHSGANIEHSNLILTRYANL